MGQNKEHGPFCPQPKMRAAVLMVWSHNRWRQSPLFFWSEHGFWPQPKQKVRESQTYGFSAHSQRFETITVINILVAFSSRRMLTRPANTNAPIRDPFHCFSRRPTRRHFASGVPRALLYLYHVQKRRALGSRLRSSNGLQHHTITLTVSIFGCGQSPCSWCWPKGKRTLGTRMNGNLSEHVTLYRKAYNVQRC